MSHPPRAAGTRARRGSPRACPYPHFFSRFLAALSHHVGNRSWVRRQMQFHQFRVCRLPYRGRRAAPTRYRRRNRRRTVAQPPCGWGSPPPSPVSRPSMPQQPWRPPDFLGNAAAGAALHLIVVLTQLVGKLSSNPHPIRCRQQRMRFRVFFCWG
jgi:hypothetical protein